MTNDGPSCCVGPHKPPNDADAYWQPPMARTGLLCSRCRQRLSTLLIDLPAVAAWLQVNIEPSSGNGEQISGSRELPIPLNQNVLDLIGPTNGSRSVSMTPEPKRFQVWAGAQMVAAYSTRDDAQHARWELRHADDPNNERDLGYYRIGLRRMTKDQVGTPAIFDRINGWAQIVHEEAYADWPDRNDLASLAKWLHRQLEWICAQPWVDDMLTDLIDAYDASRKVATWPSEQRRLKSECPSCDLRALMFVRGIGVECEKTLGGCGRTWDDTVVVKEIEGRPAVTAFDRLILVLGAAALEEVG